MFSNNSNQTSDELKNNSEAKIETVQASVDDFKVIMMQNLEKMMHRGANLESLQKSCEFLESETGQFRTYSRQVRNRFCCRNTQTWFILVIALGVSLFLIAFVFFIFMHFHVWNF